MTPLATTDEERRRWLRDARDVLGHLFNDHPGLSPRIYWEVRPAVLIGRVNGLSLTNDQVQAEFAAAAELLGMRVHTPVALTPDESRLTASVEVEQIEIALTATLLFDPIP